MPVDFQTVNKRVKELGKQARELNKELADKRETAEKWLFQYSNELAALRRKVDQASSDGQLRCAMPTNEALNASFPTPDLPIQATLIAADGSQIFASNHQAIEYSLVNVGSVIFHIGAENPPQREQLTKISLGLKTDERISLERDLKEREELAKITISEPQPAIALTDGTLELWGREGQEGYSQSLSKYFQSMMELRRINAVTAGYVDRPSGNLLIPLLEIAALPLDELGIQEPLKGIRDIELLKNIIKPGERSALFGIVSSTARKFKEHDEALSLHFFYLNVGREDKPHLARVEIPQWVTQSENMLNSLHAVLVEQANIMGTRPYPYILHRAHEEALVSFDEKRQIDALLAREIPVFSEGSNKQALKDISTGKTRFSR